MRYLRIIVLLFLLPAAAVTARAQTPELINDPAFREKAQAAVDSIYNFRFEASRELLEPWREKHPGHPLWTLIEGMQFWWTVLSDLEHDQYDEQFYELMARADYQSSRLLNKQGDHADALIIKAVSNGYISRMYANRGQWISSINRSRKAINAYQYLKEVQPDLADLKLADGLKLYYIDYLPEAHPVVKTVSWMLPEGDREKGIELLKETAREGVFARGEAIYFLGNIYYNYEKKYDKAAKYLEMLYKRYLRNNYYVRILVQTYYKTNRYDRALEVIKESLNRWREQELPFGDVLRETLLTYRGRMLYERNRMTEARQALAEAYNAGSKLPVTEHRRFHAMSGYFAGRAFLESGNEEQAVRYLEAVKAMEGDTEYPDRAGELLERIRSKNAN